MRISYNVATEGWIPVRMSDGSRRSVSLSEAILRAQEIAFLDMKIPMEELSVLRVLMAITYQALGGPSNREERKALYSRGHFPKKEIDTYFTRFHDRFDLFDETHPFLQTPGLSVIDKEGKESPLSAETICLECINNKTLFEHHGEQNPRILAADEAARKLVAFQYYALPGLAKKNVSIESIGYQQSFFNAPLVSGIATVLVGPTLFDTLCLNMIEVNKNYPMAETDAAENVLPWEREPRLASGVSTPKGYFDYLVPQSRHIRLLPELQSGKIIIRSLHITQGFCYPSDTDYEPTYSYSQDHRIPALWHPAGLHEDKALWRESAALFAFADGQGGDHRCRAFRDFGPLRGIYRERTGISALRCASYGIVNDKANPILWRKNTLDFPQELLTNMALVDGVLNGIKKAEDIGKELQTTIYNFASEVLGKEPKAEDIQHYIESLGAMAVYWSSLEIPFKEWLSRIAEEGSDLEWHKAIKEAAQGAFNRCVDARDIAAVQRYRAIVEARRYLQSALKKRLEAERKEAVG